MPSAPLSKINHCSSLYSKHETGLLSHLKFRITIIKLVITCVKRSEVRATTKYYGANQWLFAPQDSRETKFLNWLRTCKLKITLICFQCSQECFFCMSWTIVKLADTKSCAQNVSSDSFDSVSRLQTNNIIIPWLVLCHIASELTQDLGENPAFQIWHRLTLTPKCLWQFDAVSQQEAYMYIYYNTYTLLNIFFNI